MCRSTVKVFVPSDLFVDNAIFFPFMHWGFEMFFGKKCKLHSSNFEIIIIINMHIHLITASCTDSATRMLMRCIIQLYVIPLFIEIYTYILLKTHHN